MEKVICKIVHNAKNKKNYMYHGHTFYSKPDDQNRKIIVGIDCISDLIQYVARCELEIDYFHSEIELAKKIMDELQCEYEKEVS